LTRFSLRVFVSPATNNWSYCKVLPRCTSTPLSVVVPIIYYQLFMVFVPFADAAFPVVFAIMLRKTQALYTKVFDKIRNLVPHVNLVPCASDLRRG